MHVNWIFSLCLICTCISGIAPAFGSDVLISDTVHSFAWSQNIISGISDATSPCAVVAVPNGNSSAVQCAMESNGCSISAALKSCGSSSVISMALASGHYSDNNITLSGVTVAITALGFVSWTAETPLVVINGSISVSGIVFMGVTARAITVSNPRAGDVVIHNCACVSSGNCIQVAQQGGSVSIISSTFSGNRGFTVGTTIFVDGVSQLSLVNSSFVNNAVSLLGSSVGDAGGAVYASVASLEVTGCVFDNNTLVVDGVDIQPSVVCGGAAMYPLLFFFLVLYNYSNLSYFLTFLPCFLLTMQFCRGR